MTVVYLKKNISNGKREAGDLSAFQGSSALDISIKYNADEIENFLSVHFKESVENLSDVEICERESKIYKKSVYATFSFCRVNGVVLPKESMNESIEQVYQHTINSLDDEIDMRFLSYVISEKLRNW